MNIAIKILQESLISGDKSNWLLWKSEMTANKRVIKFFNVIFANVNKTAIRGYDFSCVSFSRCTFENINFWQCNFERAKFTNCRFFGPRSRIASSNLRTVIFKHVNMTDTDLSNSDLSESLFHDGSVLNKLNFLGASLSNSTFKDSEISNCQIYGANIWNVTMINTKQENFNIQYGRDESDSIKVDDLVLSNVLYFFSENSHFSNLLTKDNTNFVLILGRFGENLHIINQIRDKLRKTKFSPIVFDFEGADLDFIEMITFLALLSKFIIVDLSKPKSVPAELQAILSNMLIPILPILNRKSDLYSTFSASGRYDCILPVLQFDSIEEILTRFKSTIIDPANDMFEKIKTLKSKGVAIRNATDFKLDNIT